jgi:DNA-binding transcriptional regulator PaaX
MCYTENMKRIKRIKIGEREKDILRIIGIIGLFAMIAIAPNALLMFKGLTKKRKTIEETNIKRRIKRLVEKDIIYLSGDKVKLTKKGKELIRLIQAEDIVKISKPKKWDKLWRLVSYDVPNYKNHERDYFRRKLKELNFVQIQKSLWAMPYECREEIAVISQNLGISPFVVYMQTDHLPLEYKLLRRFNIR